jgi:hypothetical protein
VRREGIGKGETYITGEAGHAVATEIIAEKALKLLFTLSRDLIDPPRWAVAIALLSLADPAAPGHLLQQKIRSWLLQIRTGRKVTLNEFMQLVAIHARLAEQPEK